MKTPSLEHYVTVICRSYNENKHVGNLVDAQDLNISTSFDFDKSKY